MARMIQSGFRIRSVGGVTALALLTAACMGGDGPEGLPPGMDGEDGPPRARVHLFISPSGKPYRAPADQPYPVAVWFSAADRDRDGRLTRAEFQADAEAQFPLYDLNTDGQIDMPEVTRWEEDTVPELGQVALGGGPFMPGMRGRAVGRNELNTRRIGAAAFSLINEPHPLRGADADFSFSVSLAEWRAAALRRFALLDEDGDGVVLLADLPRTPAQPNPKDPPRENRPPPKRPR